MRDHFAAILGVENALDNPNDLLAYSYDASGIEGSARVVLFPKTAEEIRQILTYANRTNIPIVPRGLGANPNGMAVPSNAIVLDMSHFDRIHTLNLKEGWVRVDAGVVLADLEDLLNKHDHTFAVNPGSRSVATIGGLFALNQMDRRSHKRGRLAEHIMSCEMIDGTGKHYPHVEPAFVGLEGVGAILLSLTVRVHPVITKRSTDLLAFDDITDLLEAVREKRENLTVLSLEYLNPVLSGMSALPQKHHLLVEYDGESGEYKDEGSQQRLWRKRDDAWETATRQGHPVIEDCQCTGIELEEALNWLDERKVPVAGHIGMGILHPFFARQRDDFVEAIAAIGASVAGQFGYGLRKKKHTPRELRERVKRLKDEYDYNDIINRGKVIDYA